MTLTKRIAKLAAVGLVVVGMAGCASHYDSKANNTMLGAGLGAATGAVVSQGDPWLTLGGAAAGGVLGNILTDDRDDRRSRGWNRNNDRKSYQARDRNHRHAHHKRDRRHR